MPKTATRTPVRRVLLLLGALIAALVLGACGADDGPGNASEAKTRMYTDALGNKVEIPVKAKRIVALHHNPAAQLLEVGAPVVGIVGGKENGVWRPHLAGFDLDGVVGLGDGTTVDYDAPDIEKIIELEPDLLVVNSWAGDVNIAEDLIQKLRPVAPLVWLENGFVEGDTLPDTRVAEAADLAGTDLSTIEPAKKAYEAAAAEVRALLGPDPASIAAGYVMFGPGEFYLELPCHGSSIDHILLNAGVTWAFEDGGCNDEVDDGVLTRASMERLQEVVKTDLLIAKPDGNDGFATDPVFTSLPVVKSGQVITLPSGAGMSVPTYAYYTEVANMLRDELKKLKQPLKADLVD